MKHLLFTLILLLSFNGCQDKDHDAKVQADHDAKVAAKARAEVHAQYQAQKAKDKAHLAAQKNTKLNQMGLDMHNGTITIDTNKTKSFFNALNKKMEVQMKKISNDLQKGIIDAKEEGIQVNDERITIDLNKTKNLLEVWGKKIQSFAKEFDEVAQTLDLNTSKGK
jgi:exosome complex RNA-binding protein Rrp42 (RNase PH superfamily)